MWGERLFGLGPKVRTSSATAAFSSLSLCLLKSLDVTSAILDDWSSSFPVCWGFSEHKLKCTTRLDLDYLCQLQFVLYLLLFFVIVKGVFCTWGCCRFDCKVTVSLCSQGLDCFDQVNQRDDQISLWNNHEPIFQSIIWKEGVFFFFPLWWVRLSSPSWLCF